MEFLGNDLASIAAEKAGIIKEKVPVIIGLSQEETEKVFREKAESMQAPLRFADKEWTCTLLERTGKFQRFHAGRGKDISIELKLDLTGSYQRYNLPGVLEAWHTLSGSSLNVSVDALLTGLERTQVQTGLQGRWQLISEQPRIICDTGHNEDGIREVVAMLEEEPYRQLHMVIGMVRDKEAGKVLSLLPANATYYFTQAAIPRAMPAEELREKAQNTGLSGSAYPRVMDAFEAAKKQASREDLIFVGGSTFVVAEVL